MLAIALANKLARIAWAPFHTVAPISRGSSPLPRDKGSLRFTKGMPATKLIDQPIDRSWREPTESWLVSVRIPGPRSVRGGAGPTSGVVAPLIISHIARPRRAIVCILKTWASTREGVVHERLIHINADHPPIVI